MEEEDRISTLPASILSHILSFLPTEEVCQTSLLSKRWMVVWRAVPCVDFDHPYEISDYKTFSYLRTLDPQRNFIGTTSFFATFFERETCSKFLQSLKSFMELWDTTHEPLQKLHLACCSFCDPSHISERIELIMERCNTLKHLDLNLNGNIVVPSKLLTCNTLTVLKLTYLKVEDDISFHHLNSLKILHLNYVNFLNGLDLSQFPSSLEELDLRSVSNIRENLNRLSQVKKVTLDNNHLVPFKSIENVEILIIEKVRTVYYYFTFSSRELVFMIFCVSCRCAMKIRFFNLKICFILILSFWLVIDGWIYWKCSIDAPDFKFFHLVSMRFEDLMI